MVQLKLPDVGKEEGFLPLSTKDTPQMAAIQVRRERRVGLGNWSCLLLGLMAVLFSFFTIKEICDLKQENIVLRQMLALERQKDAALKLAVKDSIPQSSFLTSYTPEDEAEVEAEGQEDHIQTPPRGWGMNLLILWRQPSPRPPCSMLRLAQMLGQEIYMVKMPSQNEADALIEETIPTYDSEAQLDDLLYDDEENLDSKAQLDKFLYDDEETLDGNVEEPFDNWMHQPIKFDEMPEKDSGETSDESSEEEYPYGASVEDGAFDLLK